MTDLVAARDPQASLRPNRISIWPIDDIRFGIDSTYHGPTVMPMRKFAQTILEAGGLTTSFGQNSMADHAARASRVRRAANTTKLAEGRRRLQG